MKRHKVSRRRSRKIFRKGAMKVHRKNRPMLKRGGIAL